MTNTSLEVYGGVDTHGDTHHVAVIDSVGRPLGDREFPANQAGYRQLVEWLAAFGTVAIVGVEGTGSYGAGLAALLHEHHVRIVEVDRPDRRARRRKGKSDPLDALMAARAALSGDADGTPKSRTGPVEAIRVLRVARRGAVKARTAAWNQLRGLLVSAPPSLRESLSGLPNAALIKRCTAFRVDDERMADPTVATKAALRTLARRIHTLNEEIQNANQQLQALTTRTAPRTTALFGVGPETAGQLLVTAGNNPERLRSEASFAHLCAAAPIPASSGRTNRHRLNRGGDRAANAALHMAVVSRMRHHEPTRAYLTRRTSEGLTKKDIMRCLKRYVAREIYTAILADLTAATHAT
jgi:transposase